MVYHIDSNIFLRVFVKEDSDAYNDCYKLLTLIKENKLDAVTSGIVIAEVCWTLLRFYHLPKRDVVRLLQSIFHLNGLTITDTYDYSKTIALFTTYPIKYVDAQIASIPPIYAKKWTIISYDRDFDKLDVLREEPSSILKAYNK